MSTTGASTSLALRLLDTLPAASHEMSTLLGLLRIEETRDVKTAAISCERRPVLKVNPDFVAEYCRTDEHLFLLVMHELHHVLLGHTRLFPRPTPLHNLAFDAVINALLCARFPGKRHRSFFLGYYGEEEGPARLLAPPAGKPLANRDLAKIHGLLYPPPGVPCDATFKEVFDRLVVFLAKEGMAGWEGARLLGSHGDDPEDGWGTEGPLDPEVVEAIRQIVEKWPQPPQPRRGRSLSDILEEKTVSRATHGAMVLAALRRALVSAARDVSRSSRRIPGPVPALVPFPVARDRRAVVARLSGAEPILFAGELTVPRAQRAGRALVYLDVSGSMDAYLPHLYGALSHLSDLVEPKVHIFSTKVVTVPLARIIAGARQTTGGTDGACALEHALAAHRAGGRVLLLTDGYVGALEPGLAQRVRKRLDLRVLLTPNGWRRDLEPAASVLQELPPLDNKSTRNERKSA